MAGAEAATEVAEIGFGGLPGGWRFGPWSVALAWSVQT
jgi:hypothetical protein